MSWQNILKGITDEEARRLFTPYELSLCGHCTSLIWNWYKGEKGPCICGNEKKEVERLFNIKDIFSDEEKNRIKRIVTQMDNLPDEWEGMTKEERLRWLEE